MKNYFKNINIVDVINGKVLKNRGMVVEDSIIRKITENNYEVSDKFDLVTDLKGAYIMPGLIDCHVHTFIDPTGEINFFRDKENQVAVVATAIKNLEKLLKSGITYIRDLGAIKGFDVQLRELVKSGYVIGPDIKCCGQFITMTGGHIHAIGREADGIEEVRKATRESIKMGADVIKLAASGGVMTSGNSVNAYQFNEDELRVAVIEGHKANKKVATHAHSTQAIRNSILAGVDSVEHGSLIDEESIDLMVQKGIFLVPTLKVGYGIIKAYENGKKGITYEMYEKEKFLTSKRGKNLEKAYKKGVKIAMGTDSGVPGNIFGTNYEELFLMKDCNILVEDVIRIATINAAELLDIKESHGSIEEGKVADFLVLKENPYENLETIKDLISVYKNGKLV
ncbi:MAG: amidohydrolase family protein [Clostridium perfringens]|nr:amidohydrolase family protein [Clostridium perfringens]